jgi:Tfp pilus assembly protein PilN
MINLLPLEEKQKLLSKKKEKLTMILGIIVLVFLVCLTLVLLSIKFYILAETDSQKNILEQTQKENQTPDSANFNGIIQKYNGILTQIDSFYKKEIYFNQALDIISSVESPAGLYLTNLSLKRDESGKIKVNVSGTSDTRDNLLLFKKNIEGDTEIKNSYFSPESWISPKNVNFSLSFEIRSAD